MTRRTMCAAALTAAMTFPTHVFAHQGGTAGGAGSAGGTQPAAAQQGQQQGRQSASLDPDQLFIKHTAIDNMFEQQLGQLAQQKSQRQEVKQLAQTIAQDHTQRHQQVGQVARQLGVDVPSQLPPEQLETLQMFQQLSGQEFDQHYLSHQKAMRAKEVLKFRDMAGLARNDQVKHLAEQQLPVLRQHFEQVMAAAGETMVGSTGARPHPAGSGRNGRDNAGATGINSDTRTGTGSRTGGGSDLSDEDR